MDGSTRSTTVMEWQYNDEAIAMLVRNEEDEEQVVAVSGGELQRWARAC